MDDEQTVKHNPGNFGFELISFFFPVIGFIMGAIFYSRDTPPMRALGKSCISSAFTGIVAGIIIYGLWYAHVQESIIRPAEEEIEEQEWQRKHATYEEDLQQAKEKNQPCHECSGTGQEKCYKCGNAWTGNVDAGWNKCDACSGNGRVGDLVCFNCSGTGKVVCPECKGRGTHTCTWCKGTGKEHNY